MPAHEPIEFVPGDFEYNARVAALLGPCWAIMLMFGGKTTTGILVIGLIIAYMFDLSNVREGSLIVLWITMLAVGMALFVLTAILLYNNFYLLFLLGVMDILVFLTGAWATLQFRWLQRDSPAMALVLEKLVLGALPIPASILLTWAAVSAYGFDAAPFLLWAFTGGAIALVGVPLPSSFLQPGHSASAGAGVVDRLEAQLLLCYFLVAPAALHLALHYSMLFEPGSGHGYSALALVALPPLSLRALASSDVLWAFGGAPERRRLALDIAAAISGAALLYVLEMRVIFVNFSHYILLPEPVATVAVTAGLYGGVGTLFCVLTGALRNPLLLSAVAAAAALSVALALGMPPLLLWAPLLASLGFVRFYATKRIAPYLAFVGGTLSCVAWLSHNLFWFLEFSFRTVPLSLHSFSLLTETLFGLCLVLPGLALTNIAPGVTGVLLMTHSLGLCALETILYWQGEGMYPSALFCATAALGFALSRRLEHDKRITPTVGWILRCVYLSKGAVVVVPNVWAYPAALFVTLCVSPLFMEGEGRGRAGRMTGGRGVFHAASIAVSLLSTRHVLLAQMLPPLLGSDTEVSEATLMGATILTTAAATSPLSRRHFRHRRGLRQLHTFVLLLGVLMLAISPEVLEGESIATSAFHAITDAAGAPRPAAGGGRWTSWLLLVALSLSAAVATGILPLPHSLVARLLASGGIGASLGLWLCGTFLPPSPSIYALTAAACVLALSYATFTRYPTARSHTLMPLNFGVFTALFPVTYLWQAEIYMHGSGVHAKEHFLKHRTALVGLYAALMFLLALCSKFNLAKHSAAARAEVERRRRGRTAPGRGSAAGRLLAVQLDYLPVCGNAATVLSFLLSLLLNLRYLEGTLYCVFALAPLLLLLSPGKTLFRNLTEDNRYAPVVDAVSFTCMVGAVFELSALWSADSPVLAALEVEAGADVSHGWVVLKNLLLFLVTLGTALPMHDTLWAFSGRDVRLARAGGVGASGGVMYGELYWMVVTPCNMLPGIYSDLLAPYILGWFGFVGGLAMWYLANDSHQRGLAVL